MSNFTNWTSEQLAVFERAQLERRLNAPKAQDPRLVLSRTTASDFVSSKLRNPPKAKKPKARGESANVITKRVITAINMQPKCVAYRINNVGIWDEKKQIHRRANTQKGIFDVSATIKGRSAWFEIKAGYDKPSQDQLIFQQEVRAAGGIAEFVKSTDEFLKMFTKLLLEI